MARTRTGSFPIGFRRGGFWPKDLPALLRWAGENDFEVVDVGALPLQELKSIKDAGVGIGSVDLQTWSELMSPDAAKRKAAAQANAQYVKDVAALGVKVFFTVAMPADPARPRKENFGYAVDGYGQLLSEIKNTGVKVVFEGWPGGPPHYGMLACTTADYRALLKELPDSASVNFDPSHLIRMGIDPVPFLQEFAPRVAHVHGKDTEVRLDDLQEHGNLQQPTFATTPGFGGSHWRYCLPGHGCARWTKLFEILVAHKYAGAVCIEHEDINFWGSPEAQQRGLIAGRQFLASA